MNLGLWTQPGLNPDRLVVRPEHKRLHYSAHAVRNACEESARKRQLAEKRTVQSVSKLVVCVRQTPCVFLRPRFARISGESPATPTETEKTLVSIDHQRHVTAVLSAAAVTDNDVTVTQRRGVAVFARRSHS